MKERIQGIMPRLPFFIFYPIIWILGIVRGKQSKERYQLQRYSRKLLMNFEKECEKIKLKKRVMNIKQCGERYGFFNVCFLGDITSQILYSFYKGCIPIIEVGCVWDDFFKQPADSVFHVSDLEEFEKVTCDVMSGSYKVLFRDIFSQNDDYKFWKFFMKKIIVLNEKTDEYVSKEKEILKKGKVLGALLRGTDYITTRPAYHPVQPSEDEMFEIIDRLMREKSYTYIYMATEEERIFNQFATRYGAENVLSNKRQYYDEKFYGDENITVIGQVKFDYENAAYQNGLEYLSSMLILSSCEGIVAGNCGGTVMAMCMQDRYDDIYIINKGFY